MATNPYFSSNFNAPLAEQDLVESLIVESHKIYGWDFLYLPRTLVNYDSFLGEDTKSIFNNAYELEFYVKSYQGYSGNQFIAQLGYQITEELIVTCARKRFTEEVTTNHPEIKRPMEGDLIYIPIQVDERQRVFEISFVNQTELFSQLGDRYTWEIRCRVFDFNGETFNTGNSIIDQFETNYLSTEIELVNGTGLFVTGDTVVQGSTFEAVVVNLVNNTLTVTNTKGLLDTSLPLTNGTVTRSIVNIINEVANDSSMNDNSYIKTEEDNGLIDSSENNPFTDF